MSSEGYIYATAAVILATLAFGVLRKSFDPFAPHWLFLAGYTQVYVIQALSYHEWALNVRGTELVTAASARALWALLWFLFVYHCGLARLIARFLPRPPQQWSTTVITSIAPVLIVWGFLCAALVFIQGGGEEISAESSLLRSFPILMLVGSILFIVTGRQVDAPRPAFTVMGIASVLVYVVIWMIHGKRSPPLFGLLATICAYFITRGRRPSKAILAATAFGCVMLVALSIGFRNNPKYEHNLSGFIEYAMEFDPSTALVCLNLGGESEEIVDADPSKTTHETEEYGGYLLMMDTVPEKAEYDYGESYLRLFSTYIPRIVWPSKPLFGREKWVAAWIAGSELKRDEKFTGPAIGILGATQLNGGAVGTLIVIGALGLLVRTAYEYFRRHERSPWVQAWWSLTFFNAWLMTVNDDPFVWFYYIYGHTTIPPMVLLWILNRRNRGPSVAAAPGRPAFDV